MNPAEITLPLPHALPLLEPLLHELDALEYRWEPLSPDDLLRFRKNPEGFSPLLRYFGLGLSQTSEQLQADGLTSETARAVVAFENQYERPAISRLRNRFVLHSHWPPQTERESWYVHFGRESIALLEFIPSAPPLEGLTLDLGCSSGGLALDLSSRWSGPIQGLDRSERSIQYGNACIEAQGLSDRIRLETFEITDRATRANLSGASAILFNPPMVVPVEGVCYPHRDGGVQGIELPLRFIDFATRHLHPEGRIYCLATNPISRGRGLFFDQLKLRPRLQTVRRELINPFFNQSVARKRKLDPNEINHIELWALELKLR